MIPELRSDRVRILINGMHAKSGGGVTYLRNILPLLADDDRLELHLFLHIDQYSLFAPFDERIRLHFIDFRPGLLRLLIWEQLSLPILARVMSADVTFSPANYGPLLAPVTVIVLRNALAVVGSEPRILRRFYWAGLAFMTAISLFRCQRAIAVSNYARRALTFGLSNRLGEKVSVVYHGVAPRFCPGDTNQGGTPFLLAVADIYVQKNLHTLIHALPRVRAEFPEIRLKIAGRRNDQGYYRELERLVAAQNLGPHVEFLGERPADELVELYRNCAVFVFPSTVETFGNPLAEGMACGAPVAVSNTAAMPEIVGDTARMFDPLNADDMADAIIDILRHPALAEDLRKKGRRRAQMFSWADTAMRTADVLIAAAAIEKARTTGPSVSDAR